MEPFYPLVFLALMSLWDLLVNMELGLWFFRGLADICSGAGATVISTGLFEASFIEFSDCKKDKNNKKQKWLLFRLKIID